MKYFSKSSELSTQKFYALLGGFLAIYSGPFLGVLVITGPKTPSCLDSRNGQILLRYSAVSSLLRSLNPPIEAYRVLLSCNRWTFSFITRPHLTWDTAWTGAPHIGVFFVTTVHGNFGYSLSVSSSSQCGFSPRCNYILSLSVSSLSWGSKTNFLSILLVLFSLSAVAMYIPLRYVLGLSVSSSSR